MCDCKELVRIAVKKFNDPQNYKNELKLKREQEMAVQELLAAHHVLAVLPTDYGKSMVFTMFLFGDRRNPKTICNARKQCSYYFTITEYYRRSDNKNAFVGIFGSGT